ncbi:hypothetical protein JRG66_00560 [Salinimicrobium tongyeongense]|uniref:DUF5007 domain-containing protein n=1 Tax=Salinimicrobium tongyeongense TaxID=2809707 RepID=A0ABY6NSA8_9FLAO|nr:DUF5007 domain-containing protein [Salinimicrobium tongyeongense]UZH55428.1 hypothetical protein JRG66_00560 [Salinimicrobium tongyeongense]
MKKISSLLLMILAIGSCSPPEVGYLSNDIHAVQDTIFVPRGAFITSAVPASEGTTYPIHWEITGATDTQGNPTDELFQEHAILTWTSAFNPETDTTLALAEEKLELNEEPPILINSVSGEMAFTQATKFVENDIFHLNVRATNMRGSKQLDDFVVVKLEEFQPVEFPVEMRSAIQFGRGAGIFDMGYISRITGPNDNGISSVLYGTHPYITIKKVSEEPALGVKVKMIIADSHGTPLDPEKVIFYPRGASYEQNFHDNSTETVTDETGTIFSLPAPPFPQFGRTYSGINTYLMYYLTTGDAFTVDKEAFEADNGPMDWSIYTDPETEEIRNRAYIRWGIKINDSGTWEIKMKIPYTTIKE